MLLLLLAQFVLLLAAQGQTYVPRAYWTFENQGSDSSGNGHPLNLNFPPNNPNILSQDPLAGKYLRVEGGQLGPGCNTIDMPWIQQGMTMAMWIRPGRRVADFRLFSWGKMWLDLHHNTFYLSVMLASGYYNGGLRELHFNLDGIGMRDPNYLFDGQWHHIACSFDAASGELRFYIDGQCPPGFSQNFGTSMPLVNTNGAQCLISGTGLTEKYRGDVDELAVYDMTLPAPLIWQHYQDGIAGQHYRFNLSTTTVPSAGPLTESIFSPLDYAPGYPNVQDTAFDLLLGFPFPRHKQGDTLPPNIPWFGDPARMANSFNQPLLGPIYSRTNHHAAQISKILAQDFNYYHYTGIAKSFRGAVFMTGVDELGYKLARVADSFPNLPRFAITNWAQVQPSHLDPLLPTGPYVRSQTLPDVHYPWDSTLAGNGVVTRTYWSWNAANAPMSDLLKLDGKVSGFYLNHLWPHLQVDRLDMVGENGEIMGLQPVAQLQNDSAMQRERGTQPWLAYQSDAAGRMHGSYFTGMMDTLQPYLSTLPASYLYDTYGSAGNGLLYKGMRGNLSPVLGRRRSAPQCYPQGPGQWRFGYWVFRSVQQTLSGLASEHEVGDSLMCPAVSPGFHDGGAFLLADTHHIRPGQYLGWLKILLMAGADCYAVFEYETATSQGNWRMWKLALPGYAQAIASRAKEFLYNGELMPGDSTMFFYGVTTNKHVYPTGNLQDMFMVRKLRGQPRYLLMGTAQRHSNHPSAGVLRKEVCVEPDTPNGIAELWVEIRRQGSTYILDNGGASPVLTQLDTWHEWKHPSYWCKNLRYEAEVADNSPPNLVTTTQRRAGALQHDFRGFTTFVRFSTIPTLGNGLKHQWKERHMEDSTWVWVRARNMGAASFVAFYQDGNLGGPSIAMPADTNWRWYNLNQIGGQALFLNTPAGTHTLELLPISANIHLDKIVLMKSNVNLGTFNLAMTASADTVCAGNVTHFHPGGVLSGACTDFHWDFGDGSSSSEAEAQHTYNAAGQYPVTLVVVELCSGDADTVLLTAVVNGPVVNAGNDTLACLGSQIHLHGQAQGSFQWLPAPGLGPLNVLDPLMTVGVPYYYYLSSTLGGCTVTDSVLVSPVELDVQWEDTLFSCGGASLDLEVLGGFSYTWTPDPTLDLVTNGDWFPIATPTTTTTYHFSTSDAGHCDTVAGDISVIVCCMTGYTPVASPRASTWTQPLSGWHYQIRDTFLVDVPITFSNTVFRLDSGAVIRVLPGGELNSSGCTFEGSCGNWMWGGIVLEGSNARMNSNQDTVRSAVVGLRSKAAAPFTIVGGLFEDNWVGIQVDVHAAQHQGTVTGTAFRKSGGLRKPYMLAPAPWAGVLVDMSPGILIGLPNAPINTFTGLQHGIRATGSRIELARNHFKDMWSPPSTGTNGLGAGVWAGPATVEPAYTPRVHVGDPVAQNDAGLNASANTFENGEYGVWIDRPHEVAVRGNTFLKCRSYGTFVRVQDGAPLRVQRNTMTDCRGGVFMGAISGSPAQVEFNTVTGQACRTGIRLDLVEYPALDPMPNTFGMRVADNIIESRGHGIESQASDHVDIDWNSVRVYPSTLTGTNRGISLNSCLDMRVANNVVKSNAQGVGNVNVAGFYAYYSPETRVTCNDFQDLGRHAVWEDFCGVSDFLGNSMRDGEDGLVMLNGGEIGDQGSLLIPSDNKWYGVFSLSQTLATGNNTDGSESDLNVRWNPPFLPAINLALGQGSTPITPIQSSNGGGISVACAKRILNNGGKSVTIRNVARIRDIDGDVLMGAQLWRKDEWAYGSLLRDSSLMGGDTAITNYHENLFGTGLGNATVATHALRRGDTTTAFSRLANLQQGSVPEANHREVLDIRLDVSLSGILRIQRLEQVAQQCERMGGKAVAIARSLLAVEGLIPPEDPGCGSNKQIGDPIPPFQNQDVPNAICYPNPAKGMVMIETAGEYKAGKVQVFDMVGRIVAEQYLRGSKTLVKLPPSSQGIVLVAVEIDGKWRFSWRVMLLP